jgi:hypothetical protein
MTMQVRPVQEEHYGGVVWVNPTIEALRKSESLCYNCARLKSEAPEAEQCQIALAFYRRCKTENVALAVTRCPVWESLPEVQPIPAS